MFLRFIVEEMDEDSLAQAGLFVIAYRLKDARALPASDYHQLDQLLRWFHLNLDRPARFNRSSRHNRKHKAISWFKPTAVEHIGKARELSRIVIEHAAWVRQISIHKPGYVVFEDEHQIVAEPYSVRRFN
jgi:hypothetical protein